MVTRSIGKSFSDTGVYAAVSASQFVSALPISNRPLATVCLRGWRGGLGMRTVNGYNVCWLVRSRSGMRTVNGYKQCWVDPGSD